ncbi:MAG: VanW family protein [Treponema sp.]|nr:VanW family protein [Treponema sp.]
MYRFVPQKKRSRLRVKLGEAYYCFIRHFVWIRYRKYFASLKTQDFDKEKITREFPYVAISHSTPLYRNLSQTDTELQEGKANNISIAIKKISGIVVAPGKLFSYWYLIGNPTERKGYQKGMMLVNGKPVAAIGGGLCALSNLLYWMTLHTPLSVVERYRHSYDVFPDSNRTQPFGSGATCVYNYRDLMIKNETRDEYALLLWIDDGVLHGQWRCKNPVPDFYEVYQKEHWITSEAGGVYVRHNTIWRKHFVKGTPESEKKLVCDECITENHALMMYEPLLEKKNQEEKDGSVMG